MGTAVEGSIGLYTVPNDLAVTVLARRGKSGDGAFKAVEYMLLPAMNLDCFLILRYT